MLSDQHLTHLESVCQSVETGGRQCGVRITPDELRQLIAAARVANAAARTDRDRHDGGEGNWVHYRRNRYGFHRALARYTQPQPQQVSQ